MNMIKKVAQWLVVLLMLVLFARGVVFIFENNKGGMPVNEDFIAVLDIKGVIMESDDIIKRFQELEKNDRVKGYVLRVNSPGGLVTPSLAIYEYLLTVKKPLYVAMGSTAASGGYMVSLSANRIYAMPSTITGSIGVIIQIPNYSGLFEKIGISNNVIKSGRYKAVGDVSRPMTNDEEQVLADIVMDMYDQFVSVVGTRRNMSGEVTKNIADGRIYTGRMAMSLGLVDRMGSWQDVYFEMANDLGRPDIKYFEITEEPFSQWKRLLSGMNLMSEMQSAIGANPAGFYYIMEY